VSRNPTPRARVHERPGSGTTQLFEPVWARDFTDLSYEWRRLFSELFGTFLLVLAAAGAAVVQDRSRGQIGRIAEVTAPGLTVLAVILFMGAVSGACVRGAFEPYRQHRARVAPRLSVAPRARLHCGPRCQKSMALCGTAFCRRCSQVNAITDSSSRRIADL